MSIIERSLTFSIGSISVTLEETEFTEFGYTRATMNSQRVGVTYTITGTPVVRRPVFEQKHIFEFSLLLLEEKFQQLRVVALEQQRLYATGSGAVTLDDNFEPFFERAPRSRALATGAVTPDPQFSFGGYISYYPQFSILMDWDDEDMQKQFFGYDQVSDSRSRPINFTAVELDKIPN